MGRHKADGYKPTARSLANLRPGGRPKGVPNKITRVMKEAVIEAAVLEGSDGKGKDELIGYMRMLARKYPVTFGQLMARIIPLQVQGSIEVGAKDSLAQLLERVNGRTRTLNEKPAPVLELVRNGTAGDK